MSNPAEFTINSINEHETTPARPSTPAMDLRPHFVVKQTPPVVTNIMLVANVLVFVAMIIYGYLKFGTLNGTEDDQVLVLFGIKVNELVASGDVWRLFTCMFIHIGVLHLLFNLYALYSLGPLVEGYFGHWRFTAIYLIGGLYGSLFSYAFSASPSAGASGAIFALASCLSIYFYFFRENFGARGRAIFYNMLIVIGINLVFGLSQPGIDNFGHLGGLFGGALVTAGLMPRYRRPAAISYGPNIMEEEPRQYFQVAWVVLCLALWYFGLQWATQNVLSQMNTGE